MDEYVKHNFEDGQVLHAQALNEMDDAIVDMKNALTNYDILIVDQGSTNIQNNVLAKVLEISNTKGNFTAFGEVVHSNVGYGFYYAFGMVYDRDRIAYVKMIVDTNEKYEFWYHNALGWRSI